MNPQTLYCPHPCLDIKALFRRRVSSWENEIKSQRLLLYTHKGRCGLGQLCKIWKIKTGDEILVPAYNCGTEIDPFIHYGLSVIFYSVDRDAKIDIENLLQRVTSKTRAIYVTHYFGWPQDLSHLSEYCQKNHIYLVEDCALSLFSAPKGCLLGLSGDAAIYSFPKTLPVPDGGALTLLSDTHLKESFPIPPLTRKIIRGMLPFLKRAVLRLSDKIGLFSYLPHKFTGLRLSCDKISTLITQGLPEIPSSYYYDPSIQDMTASVVTRYFVKHTDSRQVITQRRQNYLQLLDALADSKFFRPLFLTLPEGVCPLFFPVIVENREIICNQLNMRGIAAIQWWSGFHRDFSWKFFSEAQYLKEHVLALPIHQQLTFKDISYMIHEIQQFNPEN
ncbi:MAG: DegT/DnrJ/EryC1/StrS family aminotransferase [Chlorobium sp.]|nr:DegT/DnrJ/EryC1/StrS family aminotransferase [Chlorobium sp.]